MVSATEGSGRLEKLEDGYAECEVHDSRGVEIGTVVASFVYEDDPREYVAGVTTSQGTSLISLEINAMDGIGRVIEVPRPRDAVEEAAPIIGDEMALAPDTWPSCAVTMVCSPHSDGNPRAARTC